MLNKINNLILDIKKFKQLRKKAWNETTVNCPFKECKANNKLGLCLNNSILLKSDENKNLSCLNFNK